MRAIRLNPRQLACPNETQENLKTKKTPNFPKEKQNQPKKHNPEGWFVESRV